jgi:hypothetical protein
MPNDSLRRGECEPSQTIAYCQAGASYRCQLLLDIECARSGRKRGLVGLRDSPLSSYDIPAISSRCLGGALCARVSVFAMR